MLLLSQKIFVEGTSIARFVILDGDVMIRGEGTRKDSDITKNALQRFVEDIGHLVFEVLSGNERVKEVGSIFALECNNFAVCTADVGVDIECLPKMVYGGGPWHGADIEEDTDI